jgi:uncharacterized protein (TIGR03437 family)
MNFKIVVLPFAIALTYPAGAQLLTNASYGDPGLVRVAPGQVVPLFVTGLKTILSGRQQAIALPLPTTISGISVTLQQTIPANSFQLPILALQQFNRCSAATTQTSGCLITSITVQIPFDISVPIYVGGTAYGNLSSTSLIIAENGVVSNSLSVLPMMAQVHILNSCDINGTEFEAGGPCFPLVTHLDGSVVLQDARTPGQPPMTNTEALPGETLVMYAYGLGAVSSAVPAGIASPNAPAVLTAQIYLRYDYRPNASPSIAILDPSLSTVVQPLFAGLTPGQVGLYQINFTIPPAPSGTQVCIAPVESNLTVSVTSSDGQSFGGAAICVNTGSD